MSNFKIEETNISRVIIGPRYAYKIKKPVKYAFVDFSSLAKRKHFCKEEVRLNRRYSPSMYLGVARLKSGEYAVKMKSMPAEKRLDKLLAKNKVSGNMIKKIADEVLSFHKKAKRITGKYGSAKHLKKVFERDLKIIAKFRGKSINRKLYRRLHRFMLRDLFQNRELFAQRIKQGKIRDLHGDLHSENIFYYKRPYIFDCIEFNKDFRYIDVAAEVSFLLLDLEFRGKLKLAKIFLEAYLQKSKDADLIKLLDFYKFHYACVEGLVYSISGNFNKAERYFKLADKHTKTAPYLVAVGGIIGTGKSTLAKGLACNLGANLLRSDKIRKKLFGFCKNIYSPAHTRKTYSAIFSRAQEFLKGGGSVVLDASFSKKVYRKKLLRLAHKLKAKFKFIETILPEKTILKRLGQRKAGNISDARPRLLPSFKKSYEKPNELSVVKIDTGKSKEETLKSACEQLLLLTN